MRQDIHQTNQPSYSTVFICLALAVAIDLIFSKSKYVSYTCLSGYLCRLGLLGAYQKDKTIWSDYLSGYLYVPLLLCFWALVLAFLPSFLAGLVADFLAKKEL